MRIPTSFQYKGHTWSIKLEKDLYHEDGTKCHGLCDTDNRTIYIEKRLKHKERISALLHELFHAIVKEAHIPDGATMTEDIEDILAEAFADLLETTMATKFRKG